MSILSTIKKNLPFYLFIAGVLSFFIAEYIYDHKIIKLDLNKKTESFNEAFINNYKIAKNELSYLAENIDEDDFENYATLELVEDLAAKYDEYGLVFVISRDEFAKIWSNNFLAFYEISGIDKKEGLVNLQNGWYYYIKKEGENLEYWSFMLIKRNYNYQNKYLRNTFHENYEMMPENVSPSLTETNIKIVDKNEQKVLFYLCPGDEPYVYHKSVTLQYASVTFAILALLLLFYSLYYLSFKWNVFKKTSIIKRIAIFVFSVVLLRAAIYVVGIASPLANSELFSPSLYATSYYLPSLGDLLINVLLILWMIWVLYEKVKHIRVSPLNRIWKKVAITAPTTLLIGGLAFGIYELVKGLVINSRLYLDVNFVLSLDYYSGIGFLIIGCVLFAFYYFSRTILGFLKDSVKQIKQLHIIIIGLFVFWFIVLMVSGVNYPLLLAGFVVLVSCLIINEKTDKLKQQRFGNLLVYVFVFSVISTVALNEFNKVKERDERKTLALKLSSDQDPVAEFLFLENEQKLLTDEQIREILYYDPYNEPAVYDYLVHNYFYDHWRKYDIQITICHVDDMLLIKPENIEVECGYFFDDYIESFGKPTFSDYLFYLDNNTGRDSYIARIPIFFDEKLLEEYPETTPDYYIYIELDSKYVPRDLGFPELLVDESVDINRELINYSFAFYKFGDLTHRVGNYFFNHNSSAYGKFDDGFTFFETENFHHLNYQKDEDTQIIISREKDGVFEIIAPFSYLFILFFFIIVIFWVVSSARRGGINLNLNFKNRVQFSMVFIVILSGIIIGWASVWFLLNVHKNKSLNIVSEKAYSVLIELEQNLGNEDYLDYRYEHYLSDELLRLSNIFFTDINLFNTDGKLLASSRSRIYDEGLVAELMNPVALSSMKDKNKSYFIHNERIGKLNYLSAYVPLKNFDNQLLGYINLPYFARESEMRYEISTFLVTSMNIYLLLLVMAIVVAFFISGYVTRPLQLIRENLSRIKLGRTNVKIKWNRNDEIGSLVNEYNRMIDELETSAELLAKNERESAWREMAKQVAHEIKNPLTPMRLSVQYLQKAWDDKVDDWDERLRGFTKTMVEQIDSLSLIASEFSDFAKLPSNNNSKINLKNFITEVFDLYKDFEKVKINLDFDKDEMVVYADPKQMLRVFNNLIKNAIQSYPKDEVAHITIQCAREGENAVIRVKDKGCGIPDNQKSKIFKPYFTTKTGGLGLGLAMVKNIIEGFYGTISFESQAGAGSVFIITLPLIDKKDE